MSMAPTDWFDAMNSTTLGALCPEHGNDTYTTEPPDGAPPEVGEVVKCRVCDQVVSALPSTEV